MRSKTAILFLVIYSAIHAGCKPRQDGTELKGTTDTIRPETIAKDKDLPDDGIWMFHYGERRFLEDLYKDRIEKDGQGAISTDEWKKIPSTGTTYPPNRRGLYVSQHPIYNERYAADQLFNAENATSGMMVVRVKKSCFAPERMSGNIFDAQASISFENQRLKAFLDGDTYWRRQGGFDGFFKSCTNAYLGQTVAQGYQENTCNQAVARYYDQSKIQLVYDHEWLESGFWLVRDPACISRLVTTPASLIEVLGKTYDLWDPAPFASGKPAEASKTTPLTATTATFATLLQAMARAGSNEISDEALFRLSSMAQSGKTRYSAQYRAILAKAFECHVDGNWGNFQQLAETFAAGLPGQGGAAAELRLGRLIQNLAASADQAKCAPQFDEPNRAMQVAVTNDLNGWAQKRPKPLPPVDPKIAAAQARKARLTELSQQLQQVQTDIANADRQANSEYNQYSQWHNKIDNLLSTYNNLVDRFNAGQYSLDYRIDAMKPDIAAARAEKYAHEAKWDQWTATAKELRLKQASLNKEYQQLSRQR